MIQWNRCDAANQRSPEGGQVISCGRQICVYNGYGAAISEKEAA